MTDRQTDIFVLVPVYNCKDYIEDAVKSVVEQHYEQIQIVLINDGSTDGSEKICNKLAEHYEKIHVIHQYNAGVSVARNAGIEFVISKLYKNNNSYIAFLDADDQWCDTFFDTKVLEILGENHSLVGFQTINCNCQLSRCRRAEPLIEGSHKGGKKSIELYRSQQFTGMFYSCELLQKYSLRFDCNMKYSEDRLFLMQCMTMANKVFLHNKILYKYRNNAASAVHRRAYGIEYFDPMFNAYMELDKKLQFYFNIDAGIGKGFIGWYIIDMVQEHYQHFGKKNTIEEWIKKHPEYVKLILLYGGERSSVMWNKIQVHPVQFQIKNMMIGCGKKVIIKIMKLKLVSKLIDNYRYPEFLK